MARYSCECRATVSTTEEAMIDIDVPADTVIRVIRLYTSCATSGSDANMRFRILRKSAIGSLSTAATIHKMDPLSPASVCTATMNDNVNAYGAGTITDIVDEVQINARGNWAWIAARPTEAITVAAGDIFGVNAINSASVITYVTISWIE